MTDETSQPITAADFLVPDEDNTAPIDNTELLDGLEEETAPTDAQSDEERLIDELAAEGDDGEEGTEEGEQETEIPPPPLGWTKEDAEAWKALTPEAREVVIRRDSERDRHMRKVTSEAAETRKTVEREAIAAVAQHKEIHAQQLQAYASLLTPQPADPRLLYTGDPNDVVIYQRQDAAHREGLAQQHRLQQEIAQSQQQAEQARNALNASELEAEQAKLRDALPEFFDPEKGPDLQRSLQLTGQELGYPAELMAQAGAADMLALKKAADWKAGYDKYQKIVAKRMESVRSAKRLPTMTRPGGGSRGAVAAASAEKQAQALSQFAETRDPQAAATLLLVRKR